MVVLEDRDREKGKYLLATVHLVCPSYLLGNPRAGCLGLFPPHTPHHLPDPCTVGHMAGHLVLGRVLFFLAGWRNC